MAGFPAHITFGVVSEVRPDVRAPRLMAPKPRAPADSRRSPRIKLLTVEPAPAAGEAAASVVVMKKFNGKGWRNVVNEYILLGEVVWIAWRDVAHLDMPYYIPALVLTVETPYGGYNHVDSVATLAYFMNGQLIRHWTTNWEMLLQIMLSDHAWSLCNWEVKLNTRLANAWRAATGETKLDPTNPRTVLMGDRSAHWEAR